MLEMSDVEKRRDRLEALFKELALETEEGKGATPPLSPLEAKAYFRGMNDALKGIEAARAALVKALARMDDDERRRLLPHPFGRPVTR